METAQYRRAIPNRFRRHPRIRVPTPFSCSVASLKSNNWFRKPPEDVGVVYDLSLRGVRVSTESFMKPGDLVSLTLRLPRQVFPAEIAIATVRWAKGHVYGLAFRKLSQASFSRLSRYMTVMKMTNE